MTVYSKPFKDLFWLLDFWYGDPVVHVRLSDTTTDISNGLAGGVFTPTPNLAVTGLGNQGTLVDTNCAILMQRSAFTDLFTGMAPYAPLYVRIWEVVSKLEEAAPDQVTLYRGRLVRGVKNVDGRTGLVRLEFSTRKGMLSVPMGVPALPSCRQTFGDLDCKINAVALQETATMTSIDGKRITLSGLSAQTGKYWHRGFIRYNGLSIMIRDWDESAPTHFFLTQQPPTEWLSATVTVRPGCDKSKTTCINRWNNVVNFGGVGFATPSRNPAFSQS